VVWSFVYLALRRSLELRRRDVLGGLIHEYESAA
jgi:hypothetical protein